MIDTTAVSLGRPHGQWPDMVKQFAEDLQFCEPPRPKQALRGS